MNGVFGGTCTSSVMSSSGRARSMNACRLDRKTRKRWSRRMSTEAGCTHFGSNGSIPIRPAAIAARMSRSERTTGARVCGAEDPPRLRAAPLLAATAARARADRLRDREHDLLGDAAIPRLLPAAYEGRELVIQRVDVLDARVDDLEAEVTQWIALREALEDHLADPLRRDLGESALAHRRLEVFDEPVDLVGVQGLRARLLDRARELAAVELLAGAVPLQDLDARGLASLEGREPFLAPVADPPPANGRAVLRLARVDDAGIGVRARRAAHGTQDMGWRTTKSSGFLPRSSQHKAPGRPTEGHARGFAVKGGSSGLCRARTEG